jgi:DNA-binding Lrp family transcriptional regulator
MSNNNASEPNNNADNINQENDYKLIDEIDQKLLELLLKGYTNKRIALEAKSPLSTIQRRIRKIFENEYIYKKTELNHKRLGLRKGYLLISLKGDYSSLIAQKVSLIKGITCVSLVTGSIDILCTCLFKETSDLFKMIESVKTIERVDKVSWAEEVHNIPSNETTISSFQGSINMNTQDSNTNDSSTSETAL